MPTLSHSVESLTVLENNFHELKYLKICGDFSWFLLVHNIELKLYFKIHWEYN